MSAVSLKRHGKSFFLAFSVADFMLTTAVGKFLRERTAIIGGLRSEILIVDQQLMRKGGRIESETALCRFGNEQHRQTRGLALRVPSRHHEQLVLLCSRRASRDVRDKCGAFGRDSCVPR